jgi:hypothetical protein
MNLCSGDGVNFTHIARVWYVVVVAIMCQKEAEYLIGKIDKKYEHTKFYSFILFHIETRYDLQQTMKVQRTAVQHSAKQATCELNFNQRGGQT